jgi:transcription elongation factor Elf1
MASVPTLTCPHCRHTFVGVRVTQHGPIKCGNCGRVIRI